MYNKPNYFSFSLIGALLFSLLCTSAEGARTPSSVTRPSPETISKAQALSEAAKVDESVRLLTDAINKEGDKEKRALTRMALAVILFRAARDTEAEVQFVKALEEGLRIADYAHYHLGLLKKKAGKSKEAREQFERVIASNVTPQATEIEARFQLGEVMMSEKDWRGASQQFQVLYKRMRSSESYPDLLFNLMRATRNAGQRPASCKFARELYAKYPAHPLLKSWGPSLQSNLIEGEKSGCVANAKDLKMRTRRLQLGGEAERAAKELRGFKGESVEDGEYGIDSLLANHLISEGQVDEAMKLLLRHYESQKQRPPYMMLLAKASARAGDYQAAIGAYEKAYELSSRGKDSTTALFQAAFTAYQIQDYDGAALRFQKVVRIFPGSKLARDSHWHMAWIKYLRGNYAEAHESFSRLAKAPAVIKRRGRKRIAVEPVSQERIKYWSAMSLLKQSKTVESVPLFQQLVRDPSLGYYSVLAYYRLLAIPGAKLPAGIESRLGLKKVETTQVAAAPSEEEMKAATEAIEAAQAEFEGAEQVAEGEEPAEGTEEEVAENGEEVSQQGQFSDAGLAPRFERARDLALVGLEMPARRELGEIEKRARRQEDRKLLMREYASVRNYHRSSFIGEIGFGAARIRGGLRGDSRQLWEFAYPRAWEPAVVQASKSTNVPEELIWGIMRAESHYRQDAASPVGALGLMQVMPYTGRQVANLMSLSTFETRSLLEPDTNIKLGSRYLQRLLEKFSGSVPLVAAGYNAGPHRVHAWVKNFGSLEMDEFIEHIPFVETRNYVKKVVRNYQVYSLLYSGGSHSLRWLVQPLGVELKDPAPTRETW